MVDKHIIAPAEAPAAKEYQGDNMNINDVIFDGGGLLLIVLTLVQIAPISINPWSKLANIVGRAIHSEVSKELAEIKKKLDGHVTMDDRRCADGHRARILHFNNELLRNIDHTKEEFIEVLAEIDAYERYCNEHPDYPNNRAVLAIENIQEVYKERLKQHDFLQESSVERQENIK